MRTTPHAAGPARRVGPSARKPPTPRHVTMNWARRLKRVFGIEIDSCDRCGGRLKIIASIEEPEVIAKILSHLQRTALQQIHVPEDEAGETKLLVRRDRIEVKVEANFVMRGVVHPVRRGRSPESARPVRCDAALRARGNHARHPARLLAQLAGND